ncbi:MAG: hypothetical protein WBH47_24375, partial [Streptosporangiaceae bacterium]
LAEGEGQPIWARLPYVLDLEGNEYPVGYVHRTHASARIPDWPVIPADTPPETDVEVTLLPGADDTLTMRLITAEELEASTDGD